MVGGVECEGGAAGRRGEWVSLVGKEGPMGTEGGVYVRGGCE